MKNVTAVMVCFVFLLFSAGAVMADSKAAQPLKAGDKVFVCPCGEGCDCGTVSRKKAKCACEKELVQAAITKVEKGKIYYKVDGKELSAPAKGKYVCACGPACDCGTFSQKAGKCSCDKPLKAVK
jgi:hypothetical protein